MKQDMKVFISSTYEDLKDHRLIVLKTLNALAIESEYMEKPATSASNTAVFSLEKLEQCNVYLCLLGVRYGRILPDERRSLVHREYDRAVELYNEGSIKDIKIYIADPNEVLFPIAVSNNLESLNLLIDEIKTDHTCQPFTTPEDLSEKINQDFLNLKEEFANQLKIDPYRFPSLPVQYVPRQYRNVDKDVFDDLKERLIPASDWQPILLSGPAGAGKTTIVQEVITALSEKYQHRIIWIDSTNHGDFGMSDLFNEIIKRFEPKGSQILEPENKEQKARYLLNTAPVIIVIDDFETLIIEERDNLTKWINKNAKECAVLFVGVDKNHFGRIQINERKFIDQMTNSEAKLFWNRLVEQAQYQEVFKNKSTEDVIEDYGKNPFILFNCVFMYVDGQAKWLSVEEVLFKREEVEERIFRRLFDLEKVGDLGRTLLLALSLFSSYASRDALAKIVRIDNTEQVDQLMDNLLALWLIRPSLHGDDRYTLDKINRQYAKKYMSNSEQSIEIEERFIEYFVKYVESHAQSSVEDYNAIDEEIENIFKALNLAQANGDFESITRIFVVLGQQHSGYFEIRGDWDDIIKYSEMAIKAAKQLANKALIDRFTCFVASVYAKKGNTEKARKFLQVLVDDEGKSVERLSYINALHFLGMLEFREYNYDLAKKLFHREKEVSESLEEGEPNMLGIANSTHELGRIARKQMYFPEAQEFYEVSLKTREGFKNFDGSQNKGALKPILHELGLLMHNQGEWEQNKNKDRFKAKEFYKKAWEIYEKSLTIKRELKNESSIAHTLTEQGELKRLQANNSDSEEKRSQLYKEARGLLKESEEIKGKFGDEFHIAYTKNVLARVALDEGNIDEAKKLHDESLNFRIDRNDQSGIAGCQYLAGLIAEKSGDKKHAAEMFQKALDIWQEKELLLAEYTRLALSRIGALPPL